MFDIGFSEMMMIAVVALIVIGPERLPKVARTLGNWIGRMNRYVNDVKADINREMELEELRKFKEQFQDAAQSVEQTIHNNLEGAQSGLDKLEAEISANPMPSGEATAATTASLELTDVSGIAGGSAAGAVSGRTTSP
jgi:sec-independent protein translocase protein TatB